MTKHFKFLIVPLFLLLSACATNRAPSLNMLEVRADYNGKGEVESHLRQFQSPLFVPNRTKAKVADIWVHPHEMPTGDYFRGGWIRTLVSNSKWEVGRAMPKAFAPKVKKKSKKRETARLLERSKKPRRSKSKKR